MALTFGSIKLVLVLCYVCVCSNKMPPQWSRGALHMVGGLMQKKVTRNMYQCENLCRVTRPCLSVEYEYKTKVCTLYRATPEDSDVIPSRTHIFIPDISANSQIKCRLTNCLDGRVCAATGGGTICLLGACGLVPSIPNSQPSSNNTSYGSVVTYSCNQGYEFHGSNQTTRCSEDGSWVDFQGSCKIIDCEIPPDVENADSTYSGTTYGNTTTYSCDIGYEFSGSSPNVTCSEVGWSGLEGECVIISCGTPEELPNAEVTYEVMTYSAIATYACILGYEFIGGVPDSTCTETGSWNAINGTCTLITCDPPPDLANAEVTYSTSTYGSIATYSCVIGYKFEGDNSSTTCMEGATWSNLSGSCNRISCGEPPEVVNATVTYDAMTYGSLATYSCIQGYRLLGGTPYINCTEAESWAIQTGVCYQYLGCYTDSLDRMFDYRKDISGMTLLSCIQHCKDYTYAGAQNGRECYCGNSMDVVTFPEVTEADCSLQCSGDSSQICGGIWRSSVYRV